MKDFEQMVSINVKKAIEHLVKIPGFKYKIDTIRTINKWDKSGINEYPVTIIEIYTNMRPVLMGKFLYFPEDCPRGFHNDWIEGYLYGAFSNHNDITSSHEFHIEVLPLDESECINRRYHYITVDEAVRMGLVIQESPLIEKMERYGLKHLIIEGATIAGPDLGLMDSVEEMVLLTKPKKVLDLFGGTGSLSKIALDNGAERCVFIDKESEAVQLNFPEKPNNLEIINADLFNYNFSNDYYDLIIADPFIDYSLSFVKKIVPKINKKSNVLMLTSGYVEDNYWNRLVEDELRKYYSKVIRKRLPRLVQMIGSNEDFLINN